MKDLGQFSYFLGLEVQFQQKASLLLNTSILNLIQLGGLSDVIPLDTPMEVNVKLQRDEEELLQDPIFNRKLVGSLIFLTITWLDISFAVHKASKFMQNPRHLHLSAVQ